MVRGHVCLYGSAFLFSLVAFDVARADDEVDTEYDVAHCVSQQSTLAVVPRSADVDEKASITLKSETTEWLNGEKKTTTSTIVETKIYAEDDKKITKTTVDIVDFDKNGKGTERKQEPAKIVVTNSSGEIKKPQPLSFSTFLKTIDNVRFGSNGLATILPGCLAKNQWRSGGGSVPADVTDAGATFSLTYDGTQKKQTVNLSGAVGVNYPIFSTWNLNAYARLDNETQHSSYQNPKDTKTAEIYEVGTSLRSDIGSIDLNGIAPAADKYDRIFYYYVIAQPYVLKDELRKSELSGGNIYWIPIYPGLNQYTRAGDCGAGGEPIYSRSSTRCIDPSGLRAQSVSPSYTGFYWGSILDVRLDSGDFIASGNPLAAPVVTPGKAPSATPHPLYLPNESFVRLGGRIGGFGQFYTNKYWSDILGNKPVNAFVYYRNFEGIYGIHRDFGEIVSQVSIPVSPLLSLAITYKNGRTENIAAREESVNVGLKVSSP